MADDVQNSTATTWSLPNSWPAWGFSAIDYSGDSDWWRVQLVAGTQYQIEMLGASGAWASVLTLADPRLTLRDASGAPLWTADQGGVGLDSRSYYTPTVSGTYYLDAQGGGQGSYRVVVQAPSTTPLTAGTAVQGTLDSTDESDLYYIELMAGVAYTFTLTGNSLSDPYLELIGVTQNDNSVNLNSVISYTPTSSGQYWLLARGSRDATGSYTLAATAAGSDTQAPYVVNFSPVDDAYLLGAPVSIELTFSEAIQRGTGTISLRTYNGTLIESFDAATSGHISISGSTLTIDPSSFLWNGTYYVQFAYGTVRDLAGNSYAGTSSYNFTVTYNDWIIDDYAQDASTTGLLSVNGSATGSIEEAWDRDWFAIDLVAGQTYSFNLSRTGFGNLNPFVSLYNASGVKVAPQVWLPEDGPSQLSYQATATGRYYVQAAGDMDTYGDYVISAATVDLAPYVVTFSPADEATGVALGTNIQLAFNEAIQRGSGTIVLRTATGVVVESFEAATSPRLSISGNTLTIDPTSNLTDGGSYRVDFAAGSMRDLAGNGWAGATSYNFTVATATDTIPGNTATTASLGAWKELTFPIAHFYSSIDYSGDSDWVSVTMTAGRQYMIWLTGVNTGAGSLIHPRLSLHNANSAELASADGPSNTAFIVYTPSVSGTYYLNARSSDSTGAYDIQVASDALASTATESWMNVDNYGWGYLNYSEEDIADWVRVELLAGKRYQLDAIGSVGDSWSDASALADPLLNLRDPYGTLLKSDDDSGVGLSSRIFYTPAASGIYFLDVRSVQDKSGKYRTVVNEVAASAETLVPGATIQGTVQFAADSNLYGIQLTAGVEYTFTLTGNTLSDPFLELLDSLGSVITQNDNSGGPNAVISYTPSSSGLFYLAARASAWQTGSYSISASTGDTAPVVISFSPADEATGVAFGTNIELTFNEAIQRGSGTIYLRTLSGTLVESFDAATSTRLSISGNTLTIDPTSNLWNGTAYRVDFAAGTVRDLAGNSYAGTSTYNFTTAAAVDVTPPIVLNFSPADEATAVAVNTNIQLTFNEPIQRGSGFIWLRTANGALIETFDAATSSRLSISGSILTIDPSASLANSTGYRVEFAPGAVRDLAGNAYAGTGDNYNFTTSSSDITPPMVLSLSPVDEATAVARDTNIQLTFSEPIQRGAGTIYLRTANGALVESYDAATSTRLSISGATLWIDPTSNLGSNTGYRVEFAPGTVRDLAGNAWAGTSTYNFTTVGGDSIAPTVVSFSPADEAAEVAVDTNIQLTFSEPIYGGNGFIWLRTASGALVEAFPASSSRLSISGNTLTIDPSGDLSSGTRYRVDFGAGAVRDLAGNDYAGTSSYNFKTAAGEGDVVLTLSFGVMGVMAGSGLISLVDAITGAVVETFDAATSTLIKFVGNTLVVDPSVKLSSGSSYRLDVAAGAVRDMVGNLLGAVSQNFIYKPDFNAFAQTIVGQLWADSLVGGALADELRGLEGNDTLSGRAGNDLLNGGAGLDTAVFSGSLVNQLIQKITQGLTVSGPDGVDMLIDVERLRFDNFSVAYDVDGNAGKAYRLYRAAFDRAPDFEGLGFQINALDAGWTLLDIAKDFLNSPEFQAKYGALNNVEFVTLLYQNVLNRAPDQGGLDFHVARLEIGIPRAGILEGFSESPENKAAVIGTIENGMFYQG